MKFIDFFAGIGGFRRGMELAGHECVGFCEFDKFATASYTSMHLLTPEQKNILNKMSLKQRQKEILKEEYRNGEWYANDIRRVYAGDIPKADCWCFGFPCQDISVAGKQLGFQGNRSSLFFRVMYLIGQLEEENKPTYLFIENVKNLLSVNGGWDFARLLIEMEKGGYDAEWQVLNSKDFGVPQNRETVFIIGHLRGRSTTEVFPVEGTDGENSISIIAHRDRYRRNMQVFSPDGITETLDTGQGGGRGHYVSLKILNKDYRHQCEAIYSPDGIGGTLLARDYKDSQRVAIPVLTPDRTEKRQNGRRFKENREPMFTLTAKDRHGVAIEAIGGVYTRASPDFQHGICKDCFRCLKANQHDSGVAIGIDYESIHKNGIYIILPNDVTCYVIWHEKYQCYIAIRKLTPKECFRLQGWTDDYFEKAAFVNSDSQLYKQAGNGVTVNVIYEIAKRLKECDND